MAALKQVLPPTEHTSFQTPHWSNEFGQWSEHGYMAKLRLEPDR